MATAVKNEAEVIKVYEENAEAVQEPEAVETAEPAKAPEASEDTAPSDREALLEDWRLRVLEAEERAGESKRRWQEAKDESAEAKKEYDANVERLRSVVRDHPDAHPLPLFDHAAKKNEEPKPAVEPWRLVTVEELQLPAGICKALHEANVDTLGKISDWSKDHELTDIASIGEAKAEKIRDACDAYWAANPIHATPEAEPEDGDEYAYEQGDYEYGSEDDDSDDE